MQYEFTENENSEGPKFGRLHKRVDTLDSHLLSLLPGENVHEIGINFGFTGRKKIIYIGHMIPKCIQISRTFSLSEKKIFNLNVSFQVELCTRFNLIKK